MLTGGQIRAARALLRLDQAQLARLAGVHVQTLIRIEAADGPAPGRAQTHDALRQALAAAGVQLLDGDATAGPGVRLAAPYA